MIKKLETKDIPAVIAMMEKIFAGTLNEPESVVEKMKAAYTTKEFWEKKLGTREMFKDEKEGELLSIGARKENEVNKLYVSPELKGKGIGKKMLFFLEDVIQKAGSKEAIVYALPSAASFYEKQGYLVLKDVEVDFDGVVVYLKLMKKMFA